MICPCVQGCFGCGAVYFLATCGQAVWGPMFPDADLAVLSPWALWSPQQADRKQGLGIVCPSASVPSPPNPR